jgi:hypothetical protein
VRALWWSVGLCGMVYGMYIGYWGYDLSIRYFETNHLSIRYSETTTFRLGTPTLVFIGLLLSPSSRRTNTPPLTHTPPAPTPHSTPLVLCCWIVLCWLVSTSVSTPTLHPHVPFVSTLLFVSTPLLCYSTDSCLLTLTHVPLHVLLVLRYSSHTYILR